MADYKINNIYQGGYSTLDPNKAYSNQFTGYRASMSKVGITTNPQTANQIKDVSDKLSSGLKQIELTLISPKMIELVSDQQLQEINRMSKLTGVGMTVHGPVIDTTGFDQQNYDELNRKHSEDIIIKTLEKSYLVNPEGNTNVTFHTTNSLPGSEWERLGSSTGPEEERRKAKRLIAVDRETGRATVLKPEVKFYPGSKIDKSGKLEKTEYSAEKNLDIANNSQWSNEIVQVEFNRENAERIMKDTHQIFHQLYSKVKESQMTGKPLNYNMSPEEEAKIKEIYSADEYVKEAEKKVNSLFSKAYEYADKYETGERKQAVINHLNNLSSEYGKALGMNEKGEINEEHSLNPKVRSEALLILERGLDNPIIAPRQFISAEDFALEKSTQTFGNAAFATYKKFKENAPIISIENPPIGQALSTGEDLKNVIEGSRKILIKNLVEKENKSEKEAQKIAEKLIGATWDVGHINILRKQGFGKEEIISETEKIKPYLKHVHLSDNFGLEHTELPMGMGNVPFKEIMDKLGKEGFEAKKVIEAGDWWQQQMNPIRESLEGLGAPLYANGQTPYWNQTLGFYQGYQSGLEGAWLPGNNYQTFGTYFSQLPTELGGSMQSTGSRMSGRGME